MCNREALAAACAAQLTEVARVLEAGRSCLIECDKDLTGYFVADLRGRLRARDFSCVLADGRPREGEEDWDGCSVLGTMRMQIHKAVRQRAERCVVIVPHLDVLTAEASGLTEDAREVIPLLYEVPEMVWLGFRDPSLPLLPVVNKRFADFVGIRRPERA